MLSDPRELLGDAPESLFDRAVVHSRRRVQRLDVASERLFAHGRAQGRARRRDERSPANRALIICVNETPNQRRPVVADIAHSPQRALLHERDRRSLRLRIRNRHVARVRVQLHRIHRAAAGGRGRQRPEMLTDQRLDALRIEVADRR